MPSDLTDDAKKADSQAVTVDDLQKIISDQQKIIKDLTGRQKQITRDVITLRRKLTGKDTDFKPGNKKASSDGENKDEVGQDVKELAKLQKQVTEMGQKLLYEKAINEIQKGLSGLDKQKSELAYYAVLHNLGAVTEEESLTKIPDLIKETLESFPDLKKPNVPNVPPVNRSDTNPPSKEPIKTLEEAGANFKRELQKLK